MTSILSLTESGWTNHDAPASPSSMSAKSSQLSKAFGIFSLIATHHHYHSNFGPEFQICAIIFPLCSSDIGYSMENLFSGDGGLDLKNVHPDRFNDIPCTIFRVGLETIEVTHPAPKDDLDDPSHGNYYCQILSGSSTFFRDVFTYYIQTILDRKAKITVVGVRAGSDKIGSFILLIRSGVRLNGV